MGVSLFTAGGKQGNLILFKFSALTCQYCSINEKATPGPSKNRTRIANDLKLNDIIIISFTRMIPKVSNMQEMTFTELHVKTSRWDLRPYGMDLSFIDGKF